MPGSAGGVPRLARHIGLFFLIVYGVGDIVGSGIYGTIGVASGQLGNAVWLAFVASMVAAMLTGLTYASISSRYPRAAGAAYVTQRAFRRPLLSYVIGLVVMASGLTSIATASNVVANTVASFAGGIPPRIVVATFLLLLGAIILRGIRESMWSNLLCTAVEVGGLIFVIAVGARFWGSVNYLDVSAGTLAHVTGAAGGAAGDLGSAVGATTVPAGLSLSLLLTGAVLTFYSFVGFEDMINVAEEVKQPERNLPVGLISAVAISTLLYILISLTAVSVVPARDLANRDLGAPLVQITRKAAPWLSPWVYNGITIFAVANTALLNFIMASRLAYGMACQGLLPRRLAAVHPRRRTPHRAILVLLAAAMLLALAGTVPNLARATSVLLLSVFAVINLALILLKRRRDEPRGRFEVPVLVPALGMIVCVVMITYARRAEVLIAGAILAVILFLYAWLRPKHGVVDPAE